MNQNIAYLDIIDELQTGKEIAIGTSLPLLLFWAMIRLRIVSKANKWLCFFQLLEWPIARGINGDEKLEIQILAHNK